MSKIDTQNIQSLTNEQSALDRLNSNYAIVEAASDTFLSRDGTSPNHMEADLDMNSNHLLNLPEPGTATEPVRVIDLDGSEMIFEATFYSGIEFVIDGGGSAISTGAAGSLVVPFNCTIIGAYLVADQTGSVQVDIWKSSGFSASLPTVSNTITASAKPVLSSAITSSNTTLTGWTTTLSRNDILRFNIDSVSTIQKLTIALMVTKT